MFGNLINNMKLTKAEMLIYLMKKPASLEAGHNRLK